MTFQTHDGEVIQGNTPTQILEALHRGSRFASTEPFGEFTIGLVDRANEFYGTAFDHGDPSQALTEAEADARIFEHLVRVGYLREVPTPTPGA